MADLCHITVACLSLLAQKAYKKKTCWWEWLSPDVGCSACLQVLPAWQGKVYPLPGQYSATGKQPIVCIDLYSLSSALTRSELPLAAIRKPDLLWHSFIPHRPPKSKLFVIALERQTCKPGSSLRKSQCHLICPHKTQQNETQNLVCCLSALQ